MIMTIPLCEISSACAVYGKLLVKLEMTMILICQSVTCKSDRARLPILAGGNPVQKGIAVPLVASHGAYVVTGAFKR